MRSRVTICQAWLAVSTATGLFMPYVQKLASDVPQAIKEIGNSIESRAQVNRLINARKVKVTVKPKSFNAQPINMTYKQPMLKKMGTTFPRMQNK